MSTPVNPVTAEQAAKNIQAAAVAAELQRLEENMPHVKACPYCGSQYPRENVAKTQYTCKNGDCAAVFSVTDIKAPRNLLQEQITATANKKAADLKAQQLAEEAAARERTAVQQRTVTPPAPAPAKV